MSDQENNPYALYPEEPMDRRPRYYDGQFLGSADFIDAQRYDIDRRRRHIEATSTPGVIAGLDVVGDVDRVMISAGAAVDAVGRQIVLIADEEKGVREADRGKNLVLFITYGETTSDQAHADQGTAGYTRFHEMPVVDYVEDDQPLPDHAIALARMTVAGDGTVTAETTGRLRAGLRVPGKTPLTLTSDDADPGRATLKAALRIDVPEGTRSNPESPALRVGGDATVTASMRIGQPGSVGYGSVDVSNGGLVVNGPLAASANSAVRGLGIGYQPPAPEGALTSKRASIGHPSLVADEILHVRGKAGITGGAAIGGDVTVSGGLDVTQAATLRASLGVHGAAQVGIDLAVGRDTVIGRNTRIGGTLQATGDASLGGALTVGGATAIGGVTVIDDRLETTGRANIGGLLTVGGTAAIGGNTAVAGTLTATGAATIRGAITVSEGGSIGQGLTVGGNITMRGDVLDLGAGHAGRQSAAGKIAYQVWSDGLDIVGAGTTGSNRKVTIYAEGGASIQGPVTMNAALSTGGGATIGGGGSFAGNLSATGTMTVNDNATFKKGMVIGQTETTGYGAVEQNGNDLVVSGQLAAGGSGGSAMYSLALGYDAVGNKEGYLFVEKRVGIGRTDPDRPLAVVGNSLFDGAVNVTGRLTVQHGTDNGIRFPNNIGGGSGDWAGLRYWATAGEDTRLELGTGNDPNDAIVLRQDDTDMVVVRNQRVGIGGEPGSTRLRLYGTTEYDHGGRTVMARNRRCMILWAMVTSEQTFWSNEGIARVERLEQGRYKVHFEVAFARNPTVLVTQHNDGDTRDNAVVYGLNKSLCHVKTGNSSGDRRDRWFSILVIGPK